MINGAAALPATSDRDGMYQIHLGLVCAALGALFFYFFLQCIHRARLGHLSDFRHFYYAAEALRLHRDPYQSWHHGYIYPPLLAFLYVPISNFSENGAALAILPINLLCILLSLLVGSREVLRRLSLPRNGLTVASVMLFASLLSADKINGELHMFQTNALMLLMFTLALRFLEDRPALAGLALGLAVNIKYLPLIFVPYLMVRRRWRVLIAFAAAAIGFALLPATLSGWHENLRQLSIAYSGMLQMAGVNVHVEAASVHELAGMLSVSITSALARWLSPDGSHNRRALFATAALAVATLAASVSMYRRVGLPFLRWPGPVGQRRRQPYRALVTVEWATLIAAALIFSPQTNTRHLVLVVFVSVLAGALLIVPRPSQATRSLSRTPLAIATAILLAGLLFPPGDMHWRTAEHFWFGIGGASWCLLAMTLTLLYTTTVYACTLESRSSEGFSEG